MHYNGLTIRQSGDADHRIHLIYLCLVRLEMGVLTIVDHGRPITSLENDNSPITSEWQLWQCELQLFLPMENLICGHLTNGHIDLHHGAPHT